MDASKDNFQGSVTMVAYSTTVVALQTVFLMGGQVTLEYMTMSGLQLGLDAQHESHVADTRLTTCPFN